jgi:hypothetical protein
MADEPYINPFRKMHQEMQAAKDRIRERKKLESDHRHEHAKGEADREGFDRFSN